MTRSPDVLRVANCSGFYGDRIAAARQLLESTDIDVLSGDWLAELTMAILAKKRNKDPESGYAGTFITQMEQVLATCLERGIKVVANAGGLNPSACARAVDAVAARLGLPVAVAHVDGDDLLPRLNELAHAGALRHLELDAAVMPEDVTGAVAANAYLGATGIHEALKQGADVVITGRVTDAALVVGPAAWHFGWADDDWDRLAGAVLAGHVIECGGQATGGNYSFPEEIGDYRSIGFPIAEIGDDGSSVISKAAGTAGAVTVGTVTAQLLYEVAGPRYLTPDVTARLDSVQLTQVARDRVRLSGVRGEPPPPDLKVSVVVPAGFRNVMTMVVTGNDAQTKASIAEQALWDLVSRDAFDDVVVELLGRTDGPARSQNENTCLLRIAVASEDPDLVGRRFSAAVIETGLCSYAGFFTTTPPGPATAMFRYLPSRVAADLCHVRVSLGDRITVVPTVGSLLGRPITTPQDLVGDDASSIGSPTMQRIPVALGELVGARSGDKGGNANLGLWGRTAAIGKWLVDELTVVRLRELIPELGDLRVTRHVLPNLNAVNFVIERFLGDGVANCLRLDAQAKGLAEYVRTSTVLVPAEVLVG